MKLYTAKESVVFDISTEKFLENYANSNVMSLESIDLFFAKLKDKFSSMVVSITDDHPRYVSQTLSNKRAAIVQSRSVKFQYFGQEVVSKPESFKGYYTMFLKDLLAVSNEVQSSTHQLLETLKMAVGGFINDYSEDKADQIYGYVLFNDAGKKLPQHKKTVASYFTAPIGKVKTEVKDVLKSLADIEVLYGQIEPISDIFSEKNVENMGRAISSVTDIIDSLVQVNMTTGILTKKQDNKEKLLNAIHTTAEYVEYYHALLAYWVFYCKAFNDLTEALIKFPTETQAK